MCVQNIKNEVRALSEVIEELLPLQKLWQTMRPSIDQNCKTNNNVLTSEKKKMEVKELSSIS